MRVPGSWNKCLQCRELGKTVLCLQLVMGKNYSAEAWCHCFKGLQCDGSSVEEVVEQPATVPSGL
jgi:hypothetical protein